MTLSGSQHPVGAGGEPRGEILHAARDLPEDSERSADSLLPQVRVWCVIPAYNNAATIRQVASEARTYMDHVLVVDDGSEDESVKKLLEGADVVVASHTSNRGKGAAILTAIDHVLAENGTHIITLDADGQHDPSDIPVLLNAIRQDPNSIVIGCREFSGTAVPGSSRFGRKFSNFWVRLETGVDTGDSQSGFRAYPVGLISQLKSRGSRYDFEIEILVRAIWAGLPVQQVPVRVTYTREQATASSFAPFMDNFRLTHRHVMLILRRLLPWPNRRLIRRPVDFWSLLHPKIFMENLLREHACPAGLAASAAVGIFLGALPLVSLHMIAVLYVTARLNLNRLMALSIQNLCMPPLVPALCIELGYYLRHGEWLTRISVEIALLQIHERLWEWLLGSLIVGPIGAGLAAAVVYALATILQKRKEANRG